MDELHIMRLVVGDSCSIGGKRFVRDQVTIWRRVVDASDSTCPSERWEIKIDNQWAEASNSDWSLVE